MLLLALGQFIATPPVFFRQRGDFYTLVVVLNSNHAVTDRDIGPDRVG